MEDKTELFDEDAVVRLLREEIKRAGSQLALARQLAFGRPYLNKVVNKPLSPRRSTIAKLGLEVVYKGDVLLDHKSLLRRLRAEIKNAGGQAAWSRTGIDRTVINQVTNSKRRPSSHILSALGFEGVYSEKPLVVRQSASRKEGLPEDFVCDVAKE